MLGNLLILLWLVYFGKDRTAEERAACPNYQQESSERLPSMQGRI